MQKFQIWEFLEWEPTVCFWSFFGRLKTLLDTLTYSAMIMMLVMLEIHRESFKVMYCILLLQKKKLMQRMIIILLYVYKCKIGERQIEAAVDWYRHWSDVEVTLKWHWNDIQVTFKWHWIKLVSIRAINCVCCSHDFSFYL